MQCMRYPESPIGGAAVACGERVRVESMGQGGEHLLLEVAEVLGEWFVG